MKISVFPKADCPDCGRSIATYPSFRSDGKGRLFRHDPPNRRRMDSGEILSCPMSLRLTDLPSAGDQLRLDFPPGEDTLFDLVRE